MALCKKGKILKKVGLAGDTDVLVLQMIQYIKNMSIGASWWEINQKNYKALWKKVEEKDSSIKQNMNDLFEVMDFLRKKKITCQDVGTLMVIGKIGWKALWNNVREDALEEFLLKQQSCGRFRHVGTWSDRSAEREMKQLEYQMLQLVEKLPKRVI